MNQFAYNVNISFTIDEKIYQKYNSPNNSPEYRVMDRKQKVHLLYSFYRNSLVQCVYLISIVPTQLLDDCRYSMIFLASILSQDSIFGCAQ